MNEDKSTRYHRLRRRASVLAFGLEVCLLGGLLATGLSASLRDLALRAADGRAWLVVLAYVLMLAALHESILLPLSFYRGFLLERRFGLSRESVAGWTRDHAKAVVVGLVFGWLGASAVYGLLRTWPAYWWVGSAILFTLATIALAHLAPVVLLPLFYRVTPLERGTLCERVVRLAERAGSEIVGVYQWHLGDRSRRANAALVGLGPTRRILLSDTLVAEYTDDEVEAILAHELGHHVHHDLWRAVAYEAVLIFGAFFLADRVLHGAAPLLELENPADVAGLPLLLLTSGVVSVVLLPVANALSRRHERRADRFALDLTGHPGAFVSAMRRLGAQNLAEDNPSRLVRALFHTHPPIRERIQAAQTRLPA